MNTKSEVMAVTAVMNLESQVIYEIKETICDLLGKGEYVLAEDLKYAADAKAAKKASEALIQGKMPSMYKVALVDKKAFDRRHR